MQNKENAEEIYNEYSSLVYKYLFCLTRDEFLSEDLVQETFVIAFDKINDFRYQCKLSTWLCQIAKNLWYKSLNKAKREKNIPLNNIENQILINDDLIDDIIRNEEQKALFSNIERLNSTYKKVVYLKMYSDLNFIEIAELLGKTPNWVRVTFFRAKEKLREFEENSVNKKKGGGVK